MITRFRDEAAFTLVEVVVAITLIAVTLIPMLMMFEFAGTSTIVAKDKNRAVALAQQKMEEVRSMNYSDLTIGTWAETQVASGISYYIQVKVDSPVTLDGQSTTSVKEVTVTVRWDVTTNEKKITLVSYRSRKV